MDEKMKKEILATIDQFQDIHGWQQQESRNALVCEIRDRVEAVLAEQKRREAKKEPQMNATMADEVRQQLATMYSLDAVEKAIRDELEKNHKWLDMHKPAFIDAVRARLTAKPTEQEIVTTLLEKWADWQDIDETNQLSPSEVAAQILDALGKRGK